MREVRKFRKGGTNDIPWTENGKEDKQMMTNETQNKQDSENIQTFVKSSRDEQVNKNNAKSEKQIGIKQMMSKIYRPLWTSQQAYKSSHFPSSQLLVVALLYLKKQITKRVTFAEVL